MEPKTLTILGLFAISLNLCNGFGEEVFTNPVSGDIHPYLLQINSKYYATVYDRETETLSIHESSKLTDFPNGSLKIVQSKLANVTLASGPMYIIDGELYLYFYRTYRWWQFPFWKSFSYAMKAINASDPMGEWETPVRLDSPWNIFEDGTIMKHGSKKYFVWTESEGWFDSTREIYITEMITPTQAAPNRSIIRGSGWNCYVDPTPIVWCQNRFPSFIYKNNISYLMFTGFGGDFNDIQTSISYMSIAFDKDPIDRVNWDDAAEPLFSKNEDEDVFDPGYATFVESPDQTETWMIYTANSEETGRLGEVRLEKIEWDSRGQPMFPKAHGFNHPQRIPSGQPS